MQQNNQLNIELNIILLLRSKYIKRWGNNEINMCISGNFVIVAVLCV